MFNHKTREGYSMINMKRLSIILLLSVGVVGLNYAKGTSCGDKQFLKELCQILRNPNRCDDDCSTSTFFRARDITTDLTYRNNLIFYHSRHAAADNCFTWDSTVLFQKSRDNGRIGDGFLGCNPILVAGLNADSNDNVGINALNLGLGVKDADSHFSEKYSICPRREVVAWLPQLYFNLDCICTGVWFELSFAVARAKHELRQNGVGNTSDLNSVQNVTQALDARNTYWADCDTHTGIDNVFFQLGYDWKYCSDDHVGIYFAGVAPTGKQFDQARWFPPLVGDKHGAIGVGLKGDYTIYECDADNTDFVFQTEFLYLFSFKHTQNRRFDLCQNGSLSRWLLFVNDGSVNNPQQTLSNELTNCVEVEPRHKIQWWANFHYQWCSWAAEFSYNLWWRDNEHIECFNLCNPNMGIFSQRCTNRTSDSKACIADLFDRTGGQDESFTRIFSGDVDVRSGAAQRVLTHKVSGAVAYNTVWCDCYPMYVGFGGGYEFVSDKHKRHALENWHVYGKWDIAF